MWFWIFMSVASSEAWPFLLLNSYGIILILESVSYEACMENVNLPHEVLNFSLFIKWEVTAKHTQHSCFLVTVDGPGPATLMQQPISIHACLSPLLFHTVKSDQIMWHSGSGISNTTSKDLKETLWLLFQNSIKKVYASVYLFFSSQTSVLSCTKC